MKRSFRTLLALAPLFVATIAEAKGPPSFNAYAKAPPVLAPTRAGAAPPAFVASVDAQRGVPTFLWAARGQGGVAAITAVSPEAAARQHLARHASRYGLSQEAIDTAVVTQVHDTGRGGIIVVLRQRPGGIEVFHDDVKVLMDRNLELVAIGNNLHASAVAHPKTAPVVLSEREAIAAAFKDLYGVALPATDLVDAKKIKGGYHYYGLGASKAAAAAGVRFLTPARVKRVWFPMPDRLVPGYFVELHAGTPGAPVPEAYDYVIAADDGRLLYRDDLTHYDTFNYRVFADATGDHRPMDGPIADYTPHPTGKPDGSYPAFATPNLISIDGFNATHDPWLPSGAMQTQGNNVDAFTDHDASDSFTMGDLRASVTSPGTFDRTYDTSADPLSSPDQEMASVADIFYVTNWLHDWWYDSGWNEAAGDAQEDNYGRGGIAGDPLFACAQSGAPMQRDNSNMSAMADGESPVMRMFVWDGKSSTVLGVQPLGQNLQTGGAAFGPQAYSVSAPVVLVDDGTAPITDGCEAIMNDVSGAIALIDRGMCTFKQKAVNAATAGAVGVIIVDNNANEPPPALGDGDPMGPLAIPALSITLADGASIKTALMSGPVTASMNRTVQPDRDGTIDNSVVAHEWGHYLHLRQVACSAQQCLAESEGWGDTDAFMMVVRQGDDLNGTFALAQYATVSFPDDPAYFGIRRYPYSIDMTKNPLTFKDIASGQALPSGPPVAQGPAANDNSEVHNAGEIWASMLFEGFVALLQSSQTPSPPYTFDGARRRMSDYIEAGLKLAPTDPTYTEQRDAILAAAAAADPNDLALLAAAFAKRGAGTCAVSPARDSTDFTGVMESFTVQPNLAILSAKLDDSAASCDHDGHLDAGETGLLTVQMMNAGTAPVMSATATVTSTSPDALFPNGPKIDFGEIAPLSTVTATIQVSLAKTVTKRENLPLTITVDNAMSCPQSGTLSIAPLVNYDQIPMDATTDTVEEDVSPWLPTGDGAAMIWSIAEPVPGNHVWAGVDYASPSDTQLLSPPLKVGTTDDFVMTFDHRHSFEQSMGVNWDGGVIEVSTDLGTTWSDISMYGDPGYDGTLGDPMMMAMNVLRGRQGYAGTNPSWPNTDTVTVNMGKKLAGQTVRIRFRIGTDDAQGDVGWQLDNIGFTGITNKPFTAIVDDMSTCSSGPPDAGTGGSTTTTTSGSTSGSGAGGGGGSPESDGDTGCSCTTTGAPSAPGPLSAALLAFAALGLRRRRRS
jgi:MYXO-CTERM domain-containing protein